MPSFKWLFCRKIFLKSSIQVLRVLCNTQLNKNRICHTVDGRNPAPDGESTIIYRVLYISTGAGFQPSTVLQGWINLTPENGAILHLFPLPTWDMPRCTQAFLAARPSRGHATTGQRSSRETSIALSFRGANYPRFTQWSCSIYNNWIL